MDKRAEILSMVERPLHWPVEEKLRIMEAALAPGEGLLTAMASADLFCTFGFVRPAAASLPAFPYCVAASPFVPIRIEEPTPAKPPRHLPYLRCRP